jgi:predicted Holliday junction resolvase-like endonuclease
MTAVAAAVGLVTGLVLAAATLRRWETRLAARWLDDWRLEVKADLEEAARQRSAAVVTGQVLEQVAPLTATFPWRPEDARFLGKPVDYVVFDGLGELRRGERRRLREIVLVDVKTGRADLTRSERRVRSCVEAGRVDVVHQELRPGTPRGKR